jgi:penicillin amidase
MWTIWGPVLPPDARGRARAYRWTAHSAERLAASVRPLEDSRTLEEALDSANGLGVPAQNIVVADRDGRIGWSIYGSIPRRIAFDGRFPVSWADGARWDGWLEDAEFPRIVEPAGGRIWTANQRVVGGEMLAVLGDGSYEPGSRARVIRDRLLARERFTPRDLLDIQLDSRATFLARWRDLLLQTLTPAATASGPSADTRRALRELVEQDWSGSASPDSSAYRFTRAFRDDVVRRVMTFALAECYEADPAFDFTLLRRREGPVWALVTARPLHLLDPRHASWSALLLASADAIVAAAQTAGLAPLSSYRWSSYNVTAYRHPLSAAIPIASRWLDMPVRALPGDQFTPRVQWGGLAASARMVVSPGREQDGILHMPTGQSGHPLSPFYANSHEAWVEGRPTSFLPGPTVHTLTLTP